MSEKERKALISRIERYEVRFSKDKKAEKDFFVKVGIITEKGNLVKPYKNLCIPQEQD